MDYKELIERAKELDKQATPGPWMWDLRTGYHDVKIVTTHSGQYYVMGFERWGMQGAAPSFQVYDKYEGPVYERDSNGMFRADKLAKSYPGKEHHKGFDDYPDHPDAKFIVESRQLVTDLIAAAEQLTAELEQVKRERDAAVKDVFRYASATCFPCKHVNDKWLTDGHMDDLCKTCIANNKCNWQWRGPQKEE